LFYAAVFALFASIGFISLAINAHQLSPLRISATVLIVAGFAVLYAAVSVLRRFWLIPFIGLAEGIAFWILNYFYRNVPQLFPSDSPVQSQLNALSIGSIFAVVAGYVFFILFFMRQGAQLFRAQTEIKLAGEIHRALVPAIEQKLGEFELYGASVPSGVVGGDLVDVVKNAESWTAYIADVSGHGVSAGVLMAMFKTAVHTQSGGTAPHLLLAQVNRSLYPLKTSNTFVTAGLLHYGGGKLSVSLAGHPPLLHYQRHTGGVEDYRPTDLPVGILPEESFTAVPVCCQPGDVLLMITDGLTEVFDKTGREMGVDPLKKGLADWAALPLSEIFTRLRQVALRAGPQQDDQTMLLVRRNG
jgi:serine phosphatase RsbU (regulator of sigma subunit)